MCHLYVVVCHLYIVDSDGCVCHLCVVDSDGSVCHLYVVVCWFLKLKVCHHLSLLNLNNLPVTDVKVVLPVYLSIPLLLIGACSKQLRKPSISLVHACHSVCPLDSHWMNICEISYLRLLLKYVGICRFWL